MRFFGIEANAENLYHGECVALGMLYMSEGKAKERIKKVLKKLSLPTKTDIDKDKVLSAVMHDKKASGDKITIIYVKEIGSFEMRKIKISELEAYIEGEKV